MLPLENPEENMAVLESKDSKTPYGFYLTGPKAAIEQDVFLNQQLTDGEFSIHITLSEDNETWSEERVFAIKLHDSKIVEAVEQ